jgi:hypothetical protein
MVISEAHHTRKKAGYTHIIERPLEATQYFNQTPASHSPTRAYTSDAQDACTAYHGNKFIILFATVFSWTVHVIPSSQATSRHLFGLVPFILLQPYFVSFILLPTHGSSATGRFPSSPALLLCHLGQGCSLHPLHIPETDAMPLRRPACLREPLGRSIAANAPPLAAGSRRETHRGEPHAIGVRGGPRGLRGASRSSRACLILQDVCVTADRPRSSQ